MTFQNPTNYDANFAKHFSSQKKKTLNFAKHFEISIKRFQRRIELSDFECHFEILSVTFFINYRSAAKIKLHFFLPCGKIGDDVK